MTSEARPGGWRDLLSRRHLGVITVLTGGVGLYATNVYLTTSLLPGAVGEIGGQRLYAWVTTVYLIASVAAATVVSALLGRMGPRGAYLLAFTTFATGTVVCALSPAMGVLLIGRAVQGGAGGLLAGLAYAVINMALPPRLWTRAAALTSAMWGVGTFVGPTVGGVFAQLDAWRWAFAALAVVTGGIALLVPVALPARATGETGRVAHRIPVRSLVVLTAATLTVAVAGLQRTPLPMVTLLAVAGALVMAFLALDRRSGAAVLPKAVFGANPLKWIYWTIVALSAASTVETFIPLFGQQQGHLAPIAAGFLGATLAFGWTVAEMISASVSRTRATARVVWVAPIVVALGLSLAGALQRDAATAFEIGLWGLCFAIAGAGIGMAWPHLATAAMSALSDPAESAAAAAAVSTVQLVAGALGAGVAGVLVNLGGASSIRAAQLLFFGFAVVSIAGVAVSTRVCGAIARSSRESPTAAPV